MPELSIPQELRAAAERLRNAPQRPADEPLAALLDRAAQHLVKARPAFHAVLVDHHALAVARALNGTSATAMPSPTPAPAATPQESLR